MELTGKCKEDFEKWLTATKDISHEHYVTWVKFDILSDSAKYGVYVNFFDSVGIKPDAYAKTSGYSYMIVLPNSKATLGRHFETSQEARVKVIKKANKIYNENI